MNLVLAATTFGVIIPAELPDKTFIAAVVMSSRNRPLPVWLGVASGLILQAGIGVIAGRLLALLPHHVVEGIVAGLFLLGGLYLVLVRDKTVESHAQDLAASEEGKAPPPASFLKVAGTAFGVVALAEFGDLTQVIVANFTAHSRDPLSVFVGAAVAFVLVSGLGVLTGRTLVRYVPLSLVRKISGAVLIGLGIYSLVGALG